MVTLIDEEVQLVLAPRVRSCCYEPSVGRLDRWRGACLSRKGLSANRGQMNLTPGKRSTSASQQPRKAIVNGPALVRSTDVQSLREALDHAVRHCCPRGARWPGSRPVPQHPQCGRVPRGAGLGRWSGGRRAGIRGTSATDDVGQAAPERPRSPRSAIARWSISPPARSKHWSG